jgi:hypothetical protein
VIRAVAAAADRLLNLLSPPTRITPSPGWLAFAEQSREVWENGELTNVDCLQCFPEGWEEKLHDAVYDVDDDTPDPAPRPASASSRGGAEPAGTGPLSPVPAGAPPLHPAVIISRTFRELGVAVPAAAAEAVAIELTHFYDLTTKK